MEQLAKIRETLIGFVGALGMGTLVAALPASAASASHEEVFVTLEQHQQVYLENLQYLGGIRTHLPKNFIKTFLDYPMAVAETVRRFEDDLHNPLEHQGLSTILQELRPMFREFLLEDLFKREIGLGVSARKLGMSRSEAANFIVDKFLDDLERFIVYVEQAYSSDPSVALAVAERYGYLLED